MAMKVKRLGFVLLACALVLAFITSQAFAAETKKRTKRVQQQTEESADKPSTPATPASGEEDKAFGGDKKPQGSTLIPIESLKVKNDVKLTSEVGRKIDESIDKLLTILEQYQNAGALRRLAEFYWKKANRFNLDMMGIHQKKMEAWDKGGRKGEPPKEPDADLWFRYNRKSIDICRLIVERFPKFEGMDEVYFFTGYNLNAIGQDTDALDYYKKLVREYPKSNYLPDSWMAIGDYYFTHNNVYDALPAYEEVIKFVSSKMFGYAKYKIAWCYFNLGRHQDSIDTFKEVVSWSKDQEAKGKSQITLMEEALRDLVMAFAEVGNVEEAEKYFLEVGGQKYFRMMLVRLGEIYTNQGKLDESITIYRRLIREYPLDKENPEFQLKIVEAYANKNDKENTTIEIINMVEYAKPASESAWVKANQEKEVDAVQEAWDNAERMLIKTVVEYHKEAIKINNELTWDKTQRLYETYLKYFQKSPKHYDVSFNYAELLYKRDRVKEAGEQYTKVAEMNPKGSHFEEASYSAILCYEKLVHKEISDWVDDTKKRSTRKDKNYKLTAADTEKEKEKESAEKEVFTKRVMSENVAGFVKACNLYIDNIPDSKYKVDIIYKVAIIYYSHNDFTNAVNRFELIVHDYPTHKLAEYAANLILDSLNIDKQWRKLNETVRAYLKNTKLVKRDQFRADLMTLLEKSSFKKVEVTESEKNFLGAAKEYLDFADEFKNSDLRDKALYNASVHYVNAGDLEKSVEIQLAFLKDYKGKKQKQYNNKEAPLVETVLFNLGKNYQAMAYYEKAADTYEEYITLYPTGKNHKDALYNAGTFHQALGHTEKAVAMRRKYLEASTDADEKDQIEFELGFAYLDVSDTKNAEKQFKAYLTLREKDITWPRFDKKTGSMTERGTIKGDANRIYAANMALMGIYKKEKRAADIEKMHETYLRLYKCDTKAPLNENALEAVAEASFYAIEPQMKEYQDIKIEVKQRIAKAKYDELLKAQVVKKSERTLTMEDLYKGIVGLKSPRWAVAALYQIGMIYKYYSLSWFNSEIPYYLTEDQKMYYSEGIQKKAEPLEAKALVGIQKCLDTSFEYGVYSEYTLKARKALQEGAPDVYVAPNEIRFTPGFESDSVYGGTFISPEVPDPAAHPKVKQEAPAAESAPAEAPAPAAEPAEEAAAE